MGLFPISVNGNTITIPNMDLQEGYRRFRVAILDGQVPVNMPIGFAINAPRSTTMLSVIDRNKSCQESILAIASNVADLIFVGDMAEIVDTVEQSGVLTTNTVTWRSKGKYECKPINPDQYLLTALAPMSIRFRVHKAAGYHTMAENSAILDSAEWFPLNTVHTLINYIRVLPLTGDTIRVQYQNGMTAELFERIWKEGVDDAS